MFSLNIHKIEEIENKCGGTVIEEIENKCFECGGAAEVVEKMPINNELAFMCKKCHNDYYNIYWKHMDAAYGG